MASAMVMRPPAVAIAPNASPKIPRAPHPRPTTHAPASSAKKTRAGAERTRSSIDACILARSRAPEGGWHRCAGGWHLSGRDPHRIDDRERHDARAALLLLIGARHLD